MVPSKFYEGLEAVVYIALNSGAGPVSSKEISASQHKQPRHLEPVMQLLVHNGILKGTKGPKGGYTLAKEKRKITVGKLFRIFLKQNSDDLADNDIAKKVIAPLQRHVEGAVTSHFDKITIEDLCGKIANIAEVPVESGYFNI